MPITIIAMKSCSFCEKSEPADDPKAPVTITVDYQIGSEPKQSLALDVCDCTVAEGLTLMDFVDHGYPQDQLPKNEAKVKPKRQARPAPSSDIAFEFFEHPQMNDTYVCPCKRQCRSRGGFGTHASRGHGCTVQEMYDRKQAGLDPLTGEAP